MSTSPTLDHQEYERRKAAWIAGYPDAPQVLLEIALKRIEAACLVELAT